MWAAALVVALVGVVVAGLVWRSDVRTTTYWHAGVVSHIVGADVVFPWGTYWRNSYPLSVVVPWRDFVVG